LYIVYPDTRIDPPAYEIASKLPTYEEAEGVREIDEDLVGFTLWHCAMVDNFCKCTNIAVL